MEVQHGAGCTLKNRDTGEVQFETKKHAFQSNRHTGQQEHGGDLIQKQPLISGAFILRSLLLGRAVLLSSVHVLLIFKHLCV